MLANKLLTNPKGFTIIEVLVAAVVSVILLLATTELTTGYFRESQTFLNKLMGQTQVRAVYTILQTQIENAVKLNPPEDLVAPSDGLYQGVANIAGGFKPNFCSLSMDGSAIVNGGFRVTYLRPGLQRETLASPWTESVGGAMIFNTPPGAAANSTIAKAREGQELVLIDSNGKSRRRYVIANVSPRPASNLDIAGNTRFDSNGVQIQFFYTDVTVRQPKNYGGTTTAQAVTFTAGSAAYGSSTEVVCLDSGTSNLVSYNEETDTKKVILNSGQFSIRQFRVAFITAATNALSATERVVTSNPIVQADGSTVVTVTQKLDGQTDVISTANSKKGRDCVSKMAVMMSIKDLQSGKAERAMSTVGTNSDPVNQIVTWARTDPSGNTSGVAITFPRSNYESSLFQSARIYDLRDFENDIPISCSTL